jgi:hypothetical protein
MFERKKILTKSGPTSAVAMPYVVTRKKFVSSRHKSQLTSGETKKGPIMDVATVHRQCLDRIHPQHQKEKTVGRKMNTFAREG